MFATTTRNLVAASARSSSAAWRSLCLPSASSASSLSSSPSSSSVLVCSQAAPTARNSAFFFSTSATTEMAAPSDKGREILERCFRGQHGKYARVLFEHAVADKRVPAVRDDLASLKDALTTDLRFKRNFSAMSIEDLEVGEEVAALVEELREKKLTKLLSLVTASFLDAAKVELQEADVTLTLAYEPDEKERQQIDLALKKVLPDKKSITLNTRLDESIGAGCVLQIDNSVFDLSARRLMDSYEAKARSKLQKELDTKFAAVREHLEVKNEKPSDVKFWQLVNQRAEDHYARVEQ